MIRIGTCIPGAFTCQGKRYSTPTFEGLKAANDYALGCGFDYIETALGNVMRLPESDINKTAEAVTLRAVNGFLPKKLYSHYDEMVSYAEKAFARMNALGIETAVFGSGKMRKITFPRFTEKKKTQMLKDYLLTIGDFAQKNGVTITIEPLSFRETNVINFVSQACDLARELNHPAVRALGDIYHMANNGEDFSVFTKEQDLVKHIHVSEKNRTMPGHEKDDFIQKFFDVILATNYDEKISCEAGIRDFDKDVKVSAELLSSLIGK